ncbi:hypothetical protein H4W33_003404 [Kibdelosporangium phytohabitans]|uniref:Uncharacterized protein n=1 Tax=Kibdelosporangium phytohabitans TaxID=860235 RepID=A0A0N9I8T2_9PSEU|nr:hypothetical protein AOZ06_42960 [Kibdelosporangium phytohabitans]MBE1464392.1 hypothetical protein [Kibdelosporangium phytohabitans]
MEGIRAASQRLIELDGRLGAGTVADHAIRAFHQARRDRGTSRDWYAAMAELAEVTGWIAFDAGRQRLATRVNREALQFAAQAGDRGIERLILLNMSLQAGYLHRHSESVAIAQSVIDTGRTSPRVHAIALLRQARAYSRSGNRRPALRAFDHARSLFHDGVSDRDPTWAWWLDEQEIDGQHGAAYLELRDRRPGIDLLYTAVNAETPGAPNYRTIFAARLLGELTAASAWDEARAVANDLATGTTAIGSARARILLRRAVRSVRGHAVGGDPAFDGVLDQGDQGLLGRLAVPRVTPDDRHARVDRHGFAHVVDPVVQFAVEAVQPDDVRQAALLEEVDG